LGRCSLRAGNYDAHPRSAIIASMSDNSDRTPTDDQQDSDSPDATQQDATVGVFEAARILGVTTDAVRSGLRRGTIEGHKINGEWLVRIPAPQQNQDDATGYQQAAAGDRQDATERDRTPTVDLTPLADLIERQAKELADLREAAAVWQIRARQAEEKLLELSAGWVSSDTSPDAPGSSETVATKRPPVLFMVEALVVILGHRGVISGRSFRPGSQRQELPTIVGGVIGELPDALGSGAGVRARWR